MKKTIIFSLILISLLYAPKVSAQVAINDFSVDISLNKDSSMAVTETITYDFGNNVKHGIYRDITYKYKLVSGNYKLRLSDFKVDDGSGNPYVFTVSDQKDFRQIKIGDPDITVSGVKIYRIAYRVERAINFFKDHDELYWNVTGDDWDLPIKQIKSEVFLPQIVSEQEIKTECFAGPVASTKQCVSKRYIYENNGQVKSISFINDVLDSGAGMTIVVGLPKGILVKPPLLLSIQETVKDNWVVILPFITLALMYFLWRKRGRDPRGRETIIAEYEAPDNLTPAEVGTIVDEQVQNRDVSAEIINLAVKGFLKITREEKGAILKSSDFQLDKLKNADNSLSDITKEILEALFKDGKSLVMLSNLKDKFYQDLEKIKKKIYNRVVAKGYFTVNPRFIRGIYLAAGIILASSGFFIGSIFGWLGVISSILSGVIIIIFSFFMPKKTLAGVAVKEKIMGLKLYLSVAEKDRIVFHNAPASVPQSGTTAGKPEKNSYHFEKLLPYAMVLGVEKEWAKQFESIYRGNPSWYSDPSGANFTPILFVSSLHSFTSSANSSLSSAPGGGSGFSGGGVGGGFGGGGGGSW